MRAFIVAAVILLSGVVTQQSSAQVNVGVSVGDRNGFYLEMGNYYKVPQRDVMIIHDARIDDDELPVVFFFADAAGVAPMVIADMRRDGWAWRDIAFHFRINPGLFFVPAYGVPRGFGRYHSYRDWKRMDMRDDDFIRFANVKFISEHYNWNPHEVMRMRAEKRNFFSIHNDIHREALSRDQHHDVREHDGNAPGRQNREINRDKSNNQRNNGEHQRNNENRVRREGRERE
jgi:hypothetical protein